MSRGVSGGARQRKGRFDVLSVPVLLAGVACFGLVVWLLPYAYNFVRHAIVVQYIEEKINDVIAAIFVLLFAVVLLLFGYRLVRMTDATWRREYRRLSAPRVRELRHTLHLVRKSPLTLVGLAVIAGFVAVSMLAQVAPALIAPYPQDGGATYYRGEFFQPPFQTTQVWRNETHDANESVVGWRTLPYLRQADPSGFTLYAERGRANDSFVLRGFRLGDVYTDRIRFVGVIVRQIVPANNSLLVSVSRDGGGNWSIPRVADRSYSGAYWGQILDFTNETTWQRGNFRAGLLKVRVQHVVAPGGTEGLVRVDLLAVLVHFEGRYVLFGTDELGRDYLSRVIMAAPLDLRIAIIVVGTALAIGVLLGVVSGYFGGWIDELLMRVTDIFLSIPGLILALAFTAALGAGLTNVMIALIITWWPPYTRLIRGQALAVRENLYVEAARAVGAPPWRIVRKHILPNTLAPVLVNATLDMGSVILVAAALSFLGLGVQPPDASWGSMLSDSRAYLTVVSWLALMPGLAIMSAVVGLNLLGDWLRDVLDPRLRI